MNEINEKMQCNESVMWELMFEVAKLRKENLQLKAEMGLSNKILHKDIEIKENSNKFDDYQMCENDEDLKAMEEAYANCSLPTVD